MPPFRVTYEDQDRLVAWAEARIPLCRFRDDARAIGIVRPDGALSGAFVFDTFSVNACLIHVASDGSRKWLGPDPRAVMTPIFAYPFIQCDLDRLTGLIAKANRPSQTLARLMGGRIEGVMREAAPDGGDMVIMGLLRRECRYLPARLGIRTGQRRRTAV